MPKEKKVYVIGQAGLEEELDNLGIARCGGTVRSFIFFRVTLRNRTQKTECSSKVWTGQLSSLILMLELFSADLTLMLVRTFYMLCGDSC
jgi:hypothetical protein